MAEFLSPRLALGSFLVLPSYRFTLSRYGRRVRARSITRLSARLILFYFFFFIFLHHRALFSCSLSNFFPLRRALIRRLPKRMVSADRDSFAVGSTHLAVPKRRPRAAHLGRVNFRFERRLFFAAPFPSSFARPGVTTGRSRPTCHSLPPSKKMKITRKKKARDAHPARCLLGAATPP